MPLYPSSASNSMKPYYQDKWVTIYHGDCREILPQLDKVDLVLTDPPYSGLKGGVKLRHNKGVGKLYTPSETISEPWNIRLEDWVYLAWNKAIQGFMIFCQFQDIAYTRNALWDKPLALITWHSRSSPSSMNNVPHYTTQFIWVYKIGSELRWRNLETFYDIPKLSAGCMATERLVNKDGKALHPTQKPQQLILALLKAGGETILDPFLGSGTTCYCAKKLNRYSIGIEIEEKYCEIAAKRCCQEVMDFNA